MKPIRFYHPDRPYGWLSNFYPSPILLNGELWPTVEHYFQAAKVNDSALRDKIRYASTPAETKRLARLAPLPSDWLDARVHFMTIAVREKFLQCTALRELLLDTDDRPLIEAAPRDSFWGEGRDGTGQNMLGQLLEQTRARLKQ